MRNVIVALLVTCGAVALAAEAWHHPLYLGNDGLWRQRIAIQVANEMERDAEGEPVSLAIGQEDGQADLEGVRVEGLRVCDARGVEMLYDITDPGGDFVTAGVATQGSTLTIPVECSAGAEATYYVYFDNPQAWGVPDFLGASTTVRNGGVEQGADTAPAGWRHDAPDEQHKAMWVTQNPHSGVKCLKTVVADGAEPTWIATRQGGIHIIGGAKYRMTAWVKADNVKGNAGWYIHAGNEGNYMLISPMLNGGEGTYDWKQVTAEFDAPEDANRADLGTVLRGTGTAWFDDVALETLAASKLTARASRPERLQVAQVDPGAETWYDDDPGDDRHWDYRVPFMVTNFSDEPLADALVWVDISTATARLQRRLNEGSIRVFDGARCLAFIRSGNSLLFQVTAPARTIRRYYVYLSTDPRIEAGQTAGYEDILGSAANLVENASFEQGDGLPEAWPGSAEGSQPAGTQMGLVEPGLFGRRAARLHIPHDAQKAWTGWRQDVPVQPDRTYLFGAWLKAQDIQAGSLQLHAHYRNAKGELCETLKHTGAGPALSGTTDWTLITGLFTMPEDIAHFQLHLTMNATGTAYHDGVILMQAASGTAGRLQARTPVQVADTTAWPVNAVVKVFKEDLQPRQVGPAVISMARNETEPLQLAIRSPKALKGLRVSVLAPVNEAGARLDDVQVNVVGYVPIDHKTSYYNVDSPSWHRKFPRKPGASDGWAGMWPDPLLPTDSFDLEADATQPVWVTVSTPSDAAPGDYAGGVNITGPQGVVCRVPFTVHVWDFALPRQNHVKAIYDVRLSGERWRLKDATIQQTRQAFWQFMTDRRTTPDRVQPAPTFRFEGDEVTADFGAFDEAAEHYFDELGMSHSYTPWYFYCFGWGHPPRDAWGEKPYEGEYPFEEVDRDNLRPEYKRRYQAALRAFWSHVKDKGWDDKFVLYISDEPYHTKEHIIKQMKALCDMIHEVDPSIPIYSSTWAHVPEWDGYLDVWGIGHYGRVAVEKIAQLKAQGDTIWWTTDGQMCTDTPYCAVERLLPHYCFKYGAEAYEFWGIDWLTYDPHKWGWHRYIHQSGEPGTSTWVRYPNGDGYLAYPGKPVGLDGFVSTVRLEQAREGVEDYEYLYRLKQIVGERKAAGRPYTEGEKALELAGQLVEIPNAGGRHSTRILPDPDALLTARAALAEAIEQAAR